MSVVMNPVKPFNKLSNSPVEVIAEIDVLKCDMPFPFVSIVSED